MAGENDILHYVNSGAFKNFNQILGTFEDSVEGACNFNDSRYVSAKSDMNDAANHEAESDPHFTVNSNDSRYVAIDLVKSIIPQKTDDTFAILSLNIQSIGAKFDHFNAICLQETWLSHKSDTSLYNIPGYQLIHKGRSCSEKPILKNAEWSIIINILRPRHNGHRFPDILKWIFVNGNVWISIKINLKIVPSVPINNIPALVQIMAWLRPDVMLLSDQWWLIYWRKYASLCLNK